MVTCGGQATLPMVVAVSLIAKVHYAYAEIVASNLEQVCGARHAREH